MKKRSLWQRLFGLGDDAAPAELPPPYPIRPEEPPRHEAEQWLSELIDAASEGERRDEIGMAPFWEHLGRLRADHHELLALQWLEKFIASPSTHDGRRLALRAQLVEWLLDRGDSGRAVPHLLELAEDARHATHAHYRLGEHYRRTGDEARALRHFEAVLARDMDYPNARQRVERLRAARGRATPMHGGETLSGGESGGGVEGARYRLVRELGRGATGVVYLSRDADLERDVAVKLLHPHLAAARQADACARFFAEARVAASLRHPNIVAILDLDEAARRIVMELAAGGTLRQVLRDRGPRPVRRALERHAQILSALAAAHRRGIVHRDLKPGNLMFRRDPDEPGAEVMLGDFGIAHLPEAARGADGAAGTLAYMSPEQRSGAVTDTRSDVYAAAVVLFEMLTGRVPWGRAALLAGTRSREDFALPAEITADWPPALAARLQDHLSWIGEPDASRRLDTPYALDEARELRDLAVAG